MAKTFEEAVSEGYADIIKQVSDRPVNTPDACGANVSGGIDREVKEQIISDLVKSYDFYRNRSVRRA